MRPGRALRIQRLEGSRPHGSLCTLNGHERMQRDQAQTELGIVLGLDGLMEAHVSSPRPCVEAGETGIRGIPGQKGQGFLARAEAQGAVEGVDRASCSAPVWLRWRAKQELRSGEPFDDAQSCAADWAVPE